MVGEDLKRFRLRAGRTASDVASLAGVSERTVLRWEGGASVPAASRLRSLRVAYAMTVAESLRMGPLLRGGLATGVEI